ncbi:unnamed protein product [Linum trigynum]|uniref:Uncharacterized protein n=1 Tax=Linum trigynum TaxID=586398 RepID=A0AAV2F9E6_9ROSI
MEKQNTGWPKEEHDRVPGRVIYAEAGSKGAPAMSKTRAKVSKNTAVSLFRQNHVLSDAGVFLTRGKGTDVQKQNTAVPSTVFCPRSGF